MNNIDLDENDPNIFPLNFDNLKKIYARRWVSALPDVGIEKISLYRYSSTLAKIATKPVSLKYCVVFDIKDEVLPQYPYNVLSIEEILQIKIYPEYPDTTKLDHTSYMASLNQSIYSYLECFHTICDECSYSFMMDAGFIDVYSHKPDEHFKNEWMFLTGCLAKGNTSIMFQEPHWVLYDTAHLNNMSPMARDQTARQEDEPSEHSESLNSLKRNGEYWQIHFGGQEKIIKGYIGLIYIAHLLNSPSGSISCFDLIHSIRLPDTKIMKREQALDEGLAIATRSRNIEAINTPKTKVNLGQKLAELRGEYEKAQSEKERNEIKAEADSINKVLKEGNFKDPIHGKAQDAVKKALDRVYEKLRNDSMEQIAEYLQNTIKPNGKYGYIYKGTFWKIIL